MSLKINSRNYLLILALFIIYSGMNNENNSITCQGQFDMLLGETVFTNVDEKPKYLSGKVDVVKYFLNNYSYSPTRDMQFTFIIEFVVDKNGAIHFPTINNKTEDSLTKAEMEIIRILSKMPRWKPGKCDGEIVSVKTKIPLKFQP